MDFYLHIFWPQETLLRVVIIALIFVAAFVVYKCIKLRLRVNDNLQKVDELGNRAAVEYLENTLKLNSVDYEGTFKMFEDNNGRTDNNMPIFEHLKAIYDAGRKSSRLDADLLVKNTIDKICTDVDMIKSCISIFLVIGILGTLIGLGLSIGSFNGDSFIINAQANNTAKELSKLFGNLRGAFAPSMWGVFFTILFVICYTFFIQEGCINKLTDKLTTNTIKVWLPALYPTDFQKGENTMHRLKDTINNADAINDSAKDLLDNLSATNGTVKALNDMSVALNQSIERFDDGSNKIKELQETIAALSQQLTDNNKHYQEWMTNTLMQTTQFQASNKQLLQEQAAEVKQSFEYQNNQLREVVQTLKLYDQHALDNQVELNNKLIVATDGMQNVVDNLAERDERIITTVGKPLNEQLQDMSTQLAVNLKQINEQLKKINNPLNTAAVEIQKTFGDIVKTQEQMFAAKGGLSKEDAQKLFASSRGSYANTDKMEETLEEILHCLKSNAGIQTDNGQLKSKKDDMLETVKSVMPIAVAVLLAISIAVQCVMVSRIGELEQAQTRVNQVLLKGDNAGQ